MRNKRLILIIVSSVIVGVVVSFIISQQRQEDLLSQEFAQLPEKPELIDEFHQNTRIYSVAFSPTDSSLIALADENGTIKLWDRDITDKPAPILSHPGQFISIGFSPSGSILASAGWRLILWDVASGNKINTIETSGRQFAFSPNGKQLVGIPRKRNVKHGNEVRIWDIQNPKKIREIANLPFNEAYRATGWPCAIDISSNGKWIAAGYSNGTINVWDLETRQLVKTLESSMHDMDYLLFSPNDKYLVAGGHDIKLYPTHSVKGYIMWEIPSWERTGEVLRGHVENLAFSPDGSLCASATEYSMYGRGVEIWSATDGTPITTIPTEARDVSFSQDGDLIVTGGRDGKIGVWKLAPSHLDITSGQNDFVRLVYNLPSEVEPSYNITQKIDKTIKEVQKFYADEMERQGFGRKTFRFETDEHGKAKVYRMEGYLAETHDLQLNDVWIVFADDMKDATSLLIDDVLKQSAKGQKKNLFDSFDSNFTYPRRRYVFDEGKIRMDDPEGFTGDGRFMTISKNEIDWKLTAYSLKRLFGFLGPEHSWDKYGPNLSNSVLNRFDRLIPWSKDWVKLSKCEAEFLDKSRYFNPTQSFFDKRPEIEMTILKSDPETQILQFTATDEDGIHQLLLFVPDNLKNQYRIDKLQGCESINGEEHAIVDFEIPNTGIERGEIRMIDMLGNISMRKFRILDKTSETSQEQ